MHSSPRFRSFTKMAPFSELSRINIKFGSGMDIVLTRPILQFCVPEYARNYPGSCMSTDAFLAAFIRFSSRRDLPSLVICDNGTNFQRASRDITRECKQTMSDARTAARLVNDQVKWRFIPPGSPHFGGVWKLGVKSVVNLVLRNWILCYQIEVCFNSRPIAGFSSNPGDLSYLTPGHFLIGTTLLAYPEPSVLQCDETRLAWWV